MERSVGREKEKMEIKRNFRRASSVVFMQESCSPVRRLCCVHGVQPCRWKEAYDQCSVNSSFPFFSFLFERYKEGRREVQ